MTQHERPGRNDALAERIARLSAEQREMLREQRAATRRLGSDAVAEALRGCGISHLYGVPGRPSEAILPACAARGIRCLGVYHQTSAVCMAAAHNYQLGRAAAAALVSAGPAATNAVTGLLVARDNAWPVLVLGGRRSIFQSLDVLPMVRHVTKHAIDVTSPDSIETEIEEAVAIARAGRPGPVYVDLHEDVLGARTERRSSERGRCSGSPLPAASASDATVEEVAGALLDAQRPGLVLGKGIRWTVNPHELRMLVEALELPFITSPMGRGFVPDDHRLCCNQARSRLQSMADVVLVVGARLNWVFRHGADLAPDARIYRVDVVHDPEDDGVRTCTFVHGDAGDFVSRLLQRVTRAQAIDPRPERARSRVEWRDTLRQSAEATKRELDARVNVDTRPMSPYRMMGAIRDALPCDAICITEGNVSMLAAQAVIPAPGPASRMDAGTNGCMGVGIPFAIGAKLACPDRPVVAIVGDYGFSLAAMELEACVRHRIAIVVVIANNEGNCGALKQTAYFPERAHERVTMFMPGLEYDRIMTLFGGEGATITEPADLGPALVGALASGVPTCINVRVDPSLPMPSAWGEPTSDRRDAR